MFSDSAFGRWVRGSFLAKLMVLNGLVFFAIQSVLIYRNLAGYEGAFAHEDLWLAAHTGVGLWHRPWSVLTHMFTHVSFSHFLWNMVWLYFSGSLFERFFRGSQLAALYVMAGLFGFVVLCAIVAFSSLEPGLAMGASAAVMSIFIATAVRSPDMEVRFLALIPIKLKYLAIVYVVLDYMALRGEVNVGGHIAHLAGATFGLVFAQQMIKGRSIVRPAEALGKLLVRALSGSNTPAQRTKVRHMTDEDFNAKKRNDEKRLDVVLDKISRSGYDSLTREEKDFLFKSGNGNR